MFYRQFYMHSPTKSMLFDGNVIETDLGNCCKRPIVAIVQQYEPGIKTNKSWTILCMKMCFGTSRNSLIFATGGCNYQKSHLIFAFVIFHKNLTWVICGGYGKTLPKDVMRWHRTCRAPVNQTGIIIASSGSAWINMADLSFLLLAFFPSFFLLSYD